DFSTSFGYESVPGTFGPSCDPLGDPPVKDVVVDLDPLRDGERTSALHSAMNRFLEPLDRLQALMSIAV
ncbi:MAG: hypothetical protein WD847_20670, partial [Pirellulales bacterium]